MNEYLLQSFVFYIKYFIDRRFSMTGLAVGCINQPEKNHHFLCLKGAKNANMILFTLIYRTFMWTITFTLIFFMVFWDLITHRSCVKYFFFISYKKKEQFIFCTAKKTLNSQQMRLSKYQMNIFFKSIPLAVNNLYRYRGQQLFYLNISRVKCEFESLPVWEMPFYNWL